VAATAAALSASFVLAALPNNFFAIFCTTVKPAGTTSLVLGTSSGIHAWHNDHYVRRMRVGRTRLYIHIYLYTTLS
jgi:ribonucleoside-diphosphate reductase alpha chain